MTKNVAYMVELNGKTHFVNNLSIGLFRKEFTLSEHYQSTNFDTVYLSNRYKYNVAKMIFDKLKYNFTWIQVYMIRDDGTKEELLRHLMKL